MVLLKMWMESFFVVLDCHVHYKMLGSISGPSPVDAKGPLILVVMLFPIWQNSPWLIMAYYSLIILARTE